uniref:Uncharacterized protein n=1 Tax=Podoviridae sp. ctrTt13 TaxID=2825279 RepID=A0A8S5NSL7_9CAUD|nr:MAG TPA: hypothetical protein [Podoviridae sp. ctrTt13]
MPRKRFNPGSLTSLSARPCAKSNRSVEGVPSGMLSTLH